MHIIEMPSRPSRTHSRSPITPTSSTSMVGNGGSGGGGSSGGGGGVGSGGSDRTFMPTSPSSIVDEDQEEHIEPHVLHSPQQPREGYHGFNHGLSRRRGSQQVQLLSSPEHSMMEKYTHVQTHASPSLGYEDGEGRGLNGTAFARGEMRHHHHQPGTRHQNGTTTTTPATATAPVTITGPPPVPPYFFHPPPSLAASQTLNSNHPSSMAAAMMLSSESSGDDTTPLSPPTAMAMNGMNGIRWSIPPHSHPGSTGSAPTDPIDLDSPASLSQDRTNSVQAYSTLSTTKTRSLTNTNTTIPSTQNGSMSSPPPHLSSSNGTANGNIPDHMTDLYLPRKLPYHHNQHPQHVPLTSNSALAREKSQQLPHSLPPSPHPLPSGKHHASSPAHKPICIHSSREHLDRIAKSIDELSPSFLQDVMDPSTDPKYYGPASGGLYGFQYKDDDDDGGEYNHHHDDNDDYDDFDKFDSKDNIRARAESEPHSQKALRQRLRRRSRTCANSSSSDQTNPFSMKRLAHRLSLTFKDKESEREYQSFFAARHTPVWRSYLIMAALSTLLLSGLEHLYRAPPIAAAVLVPVGIISHIGLALAYSWFRPFEVFARQIHTISSSIVCWTAFLGVYLYNVVIPPSADLYKAGLVFAVTVATGPFLLRLRFAYASVTCVINLVVFMVLSAVIQGPGWSIGVYTFVGALLLLLMVFFSMYAYEWERSSREQFMRSQYYARTNAKLVKQLLNVQQSYQRIADFDSPLEKAITILKSLLADPSTKVSHIKALSSAIRGLNSGNLLMPDLQSQVEMGKMNVDQEQKHWLFTTVTERTEIPAASQTAQAIRRRSTGLLETRLDTATALAGFGFHSKEKELLADGSQLHRQTKPKLANDSSILYNEQNSTVLALQVKDDVYEEAFDSSGAATPLSARPIHIIQQQQQDTSVMSASSVEDISDGANTTNRSSSIVTPMRSSGRRPSYLGEFGRKFDEFTVIAEMNPDIPNQVVAITFKPAKSPLPTEIDAVHPMRRHLRSRRVDMRKLSPLLDQALDWNWPIFDFAAQTHDRPILPFALRLFEDTQLFDTFKIPIDRFLRCIATLERGYSSELTYHNAIHACDVLQACAYFAKVPAVKCVMTEVELMALFFAAIIHDHDHGGFTNNFLVETEDPKAILYNDRSVLENHHLSTSFRVLYREENNFICHLSKEDKKLFRELVIDLVLATDLKQHFALLSLFKSKVAVPETFSQLEQKEDRFLLWKILIKCADMSNPSKEWCLCKQWTSRVTNEFFRQGDEERRLQFPLSAFMDRENPNIAGCQISFINFICTPIFEALDNFVSIPLIVSQLHDNYKRWTSIKERSPSNANLHQCSNAKSSSDNVDDKELHTPPPAAAAAPATILKHSTSDRKSKTSTPARSREPALHDPPPSSTGRSSPRNSPRQTAASTKPQYSSRSNSLVPKKSASVSPTTVPLKSTDSSTEMSSISLRESKSSSGFLSGKKRKPNSSSANSTPNQGKTSDMSAPELSVSENLWESADSEMRSGIADTTTSSDQRNSLRPGADMAELGSNTSQS